MAPSFEVIREIQGRYFAQMRYRELMEGLQHIAVLE